MPDPRLGHGSDFARYQRELSNWLHANVCDVRSLSPKEIKEYSWKHVVAGWEVRLPDSDRRFRVLLDDSFPYSRIQVAYKGEDRHLQWPHTEEHNFLCLPDEGWRPSENIEHSIAGRLTQATNLVTSCQSEYFVKSESEREFLTYWGRQTSKLSALSIIDLKDTKARRITAKPYNGGYLLGESEEQLETRLEKIGIDRSVSSIQAILTFIDQKPSLPLPQSGRQFVRQLLDQTPTLNGVIGGLSPFQPTLIILASRDDKETGIALFGAKLDAAPKDGFRSNPKPASLKRIWGFVSRYSPIQVNRADSGWVHGRDQNPEEHRILSRSHLVFLGAGSLGSQAACRLAQAGVGRMTIIDPGNLEPSNVGRHALGMESVNTNKALSLAKLLSARYPHGDFKGFNERWQDVLREKPGIFGHANLAVNCIGEIEHDLSWDSVHQSGRVGDITTLYGWLGTQGTTGHALALTAGCAALSCFFDPDGFIKSPDTEFSGGDQLRAEPACGTEFQPYGPLAAGQIELLVTRAAIDILTGKISPPYHRVYACSTDDLSELGGKWTDHHNAQRPDGYDGPFEYTVSVDRCNDCHNCQ